LNQKPIALAADHKRILIGNYALTATLDFTNPALTAVVSWSFRGISALIAHTKFQGLDEPARNLGFLQMDRRLWIFKSQNPELGREIVIPLISHS
jgi:hypothetical protein